MNVDLRLLACCAIVAVVPHHHHRAVLHSCHRHHHKCAVAKPRPQVHIGRPVIVDSTPAVPASAPAPVAVVPAPGDELTDQESERIWIETHESEVSVCTPPLEQEGWTCEVVEAHEAQTAEDGGLGGLGTETPSGYSR